MVPQTHLVGAISEFQQLFLIPADQRRNQQASEAEVVERLRGEAQRGHQVLHRQRRTETQTVDAGDRHTRRVQPGDDEASQFSALPDQHHDVARSSLAFPALDQRETVPQPELDLRGDVVGHGPLGPGEPGILRRKLFLFTLAPDRLP